jgi:DNA-binding PadR family transcriptional regulator
MNLTVKDREFLEAVAQDTLPRYNSLGALHRAANRLIRKGLLTSTRVLGGEWTRYSLTEAGSAEVATTTKEGT